MVDLGTGDGAAVVDAARAAPATLCVGLDTDAAAMRERSTRAARPARRGGLPNALFLAGDARALPAAFAGRIDAVHLTLPWGSLLRMVLEAETDLVAAIATGLRPGGRLAVMTSVDQRDRASLGDLARHADLALLADALADAGLRVTTLRGVVDSDVATLRSSWARRLGIPARRSARLLSAEKPDSAGG